MNVEQALRTAINFRRYRVAKSGRTVWDQHHGEFVPQFLIPRCTKAQMAKADRIMGLKNKLGAVRRIDTAKVRSTQPSLRRKNLLYHIARRDRYQKTFGGRNAPIGIRGVNLPIVVFVDGVPIIWNGNHRITANILLGYRVIMCRAYKAR